MSVSVFDTLQNGGVTLQEMKVLYSPDPEIQRHRDHKIDELMQNFVGLSRSTIENVLVQNDWNENNAIIPLFHIYEDHQRKQQEKRKVQEITQKRLELINNEFTEKDFKQKLEENDGDQEATINQLLDALEKRQAQKRREQELLNRQYENEKAISTLQQRFPDMNSEDIVNTLKRFNWNLVTAGKEILQISEQKKIKLLAKLYPASSKLEIEEALEASNWIFGEACNILIQKKPIPVITKNNLEDSLRIRGDKLVEQILSDPNEKFPTYEMIAESNVRRELEARFRNTPALQPGQQPIETQPNPVTITEPATKDSNEIVSLTLNQTVFDVNNEITIQWKVKDESYNPSNDWIALYEASEDDIQKYLCYLWVASSAKQGFLKFTAPLQYGKYRFAYLMNKSYRILAETPIVSVGPVYELSGKYQHDSITDTREIFVSFKKISGNEHPNSWIGMYKPGSLNSQIHEYQWVSSAVNSTLKFVVPKGGVWEFKLFPERNYIGPYIEVAQCSVLVPGKDTLILTHNGAQSTIEYDIQTLDPATDRIWIGVFFESSTSSTDYRRSKNITSAKGIYTIKTPIHEGTYHARLYGLGSNVFSATSNSISVPDTTK